MGWITPNPRHPRWSLEGTRWQVWAPEDKRTFVVGRVNNLGNLVTIKRGFRQRATALAYAEQQAAKEA